MAENMFHNNSTLILNPSQHFEKIQFVEEAFLINKNFPKSFLNVAMFSGTVVVITITNTLVLMWLKLKDRVLIDKMIFMDCVANIGMIGMIFLAFPCRVWSNKYLCAAITFFRALIVTLNRLAL